uniref:Peroxisomal membrane protein 4 n=1 Tax=Heterorhabditis bacteriophora TaxID=37862 RepID=A0A1I7XK20_HETBA
MVFLFGEGTFIEKIQTILRLTKTHALNLAKFVFSYKLILGLLEKFQGRKKEWHSFTAAFIMGYFVFGDNNAVNTQINLYLLSRVTLGLVKLAVENKIMPQPAFPVFPWFAAMLWGLVLWMFEHHSGVLHGSLVKSMTYLYKDSDVWTNIRNFIIKNK